VVRGNAIQTEEVSAYSAVALAGLGELPDTILSRSVIVRMRRRHQGETVEPFRRRIHAIEAGRIRDKIAIWAQAQTGDVQWPELPAEIQDRDADVWEPLLAVADAAGGEWPQRARVSAVTLVTLLREGGEASPGVRLLNDLRTVFGSAGEMSTKSLLAHLHAMDEAPWGDLNGKPLDDRGLAARLRKYGVKP
jgi:hypothetical protein